MEYNQFKKKLKSKFYEKIGIELDENKCQKFFDFMNILLEKNKVMNLTTITDPDEVIIKHFVDSCMFLKFYNNFAGKKIVDIGTGAGFPGIPLSIVDESNKYVLTDTLGKRINFLVDVKNALNLKNVEIFKFRAEDFAHESNFREKFDYVVARGVAKVSVLAEYLLPCVAINGSMIAYKMDDCFDELNDGKNAIDILGGMFHVKHSYTLFESEPKRCLLEIKKIKSTPKQYPRKAGTPSKSPL